MLEGPSLLYGKSVDDVPIICVSSIESGFGWQWPRNGWLRFDGECLQKGNTGMRICVMSRNDPYNKETTPTRIHIISAISPGAPIEYDAEAEYFRSPEERHP